MRFYNVNLYGRRRFMLFLYAESAFMTMTAILRCTALNNYPQQARWSEKEKRAENRRASIRDIAMESLSSLFFVFLLACLTFGGAVGRRRRRRSKRIIPPSGRTGIADAMDAAYKQQYGNDKKNDADNDRDRMARGIFPLEEKLFKHVHIKYHQVNCGNYLEYKYQAL